MQKTTKKDASLYKVCIELLQFNIKQRQFYAKQERFHVEQDESDIKLFQFHI